MRKLLGLITCLIMLAAIPAVVATAEDFDQAASSPDAQPVDESTYVEVEPSVESSDLTGEPASGDPSLSRSQVDTEVPVDAASADIYDPALDGVVSSGEEGSSSSSTGTGSADTKVCHPVNQPPATVSGVCQSIKIGKTKLSFFQGIIWAGKVFYKFGALPSQLEVLSGKYDALNASICDGEVSTVDRVQACSILDELETAQGNLSSYCDPSLSGCQKLNEEWLKEDENGCSTKEHAALGTARMKQALSCGP